MRIITVQSDGAIKEEATITRRQVFEKIHAIAGRYLSAVHESGILTTDMDGVLIHDDNAVMAARIISGPEAQELYSVYADANIKAVAEGKTAYCWYAPALFVGQMLKGLSSEINRTIGRNVRLIPGAREHIEKLLDSGYDITTVTAGHEDAAKEISERVNIGITKGTQLGVAEDSFYDGTVKKFVGGIHKLGVVEKLLQYEGELAGTHVGDSWSDVETLAGIPNSVAFNPGCEFALRNAKISVIGYSLLCLLPFFDPEGKYDEKMNGTNMPDAVIVMEGQPSQENAQALLAVSKRVKKYMIGELLDKSECPVAEIEERIKAELREKGVDFRAGHSEFMPVDEFDAYAKKAYEDLEQ
ncbi:hypothetical protein GF343_02260 [Candidatus Woesearchaeota archaeon]|nr:hypothetical protein [Candidatus Woesearchaeota archaeon]